jgi:peptidyl-tRNA hydrolase
MKQMKLTGETRELEVINTTTNYSQIKLGISRRATNKIVSHHMISEESHSESQLELPARSLEFGGEGLAA